MLQDPLMKPQQKLQSVNNRLANAVQRFSVGTADHLDSKNPVSVPLKFGFFTHRVWNRRENPCSTKRKGRCVQRMDAY